jgi:hypothetical protein
VPAPPKTYWNHTDEYPVGCSFGELLEWHLLHWGTRPNHSKKKRKAWIVWRFAAAVYDKDTASKDYAYFDTETKNLLSWRQGLNHPKDQEVVERIFKILFGDDDEYTDWKNDLAGALTRPVERSPLLKKASDSSGYSELASEASSIFQAADAWPTISPAAAQLADCMSDISEKCYCAGWLFDLEYILWHAVISGPTVFGNGYITSEQIELLKILSSACGGWITFDLDAPRDVSSKKWIPLEYWKAHFNNPDQCPLEGKVFVDHSADGQRQLIYGFVDDASRSTWKREALFFDKIVLPDFTWALDPDGVHYSDPYIWDDNHIAGNARQIIDLINKGVFLPSEAFGHPKGDREIAVENERNKYSYEKPEYIALSARLKSLKFSRLHGVEAYPIYQSLHTFSSGLAQRREAVLRVVFAKIPMPLESVSWDEIIDYRLDPESNRRFSALRMWVNRATSGLTPITEVTEELEHLTAEFEAHLRSHRMRFCLTPLETVISEQPEIIREMAQRNNAAEGRKTFSMHADNGTLFPDVELTAPGKELAYITATSARFSVRSS